MTIGQLWSTCISCFRGHTPTEVVARRKDEAFRQSIKNFLHDNEFERSATTYIIDEYLEAGGHRSHGRVSEYFLELTNDKLEDIFLHNAMYVCVCYDKETDVRPSEIALFMLQKHDFDAENDRVSIPHWYPADKFVDDMQDTPVKEWYRFAEMDERDIGIVMPLPERPKTPSNGAHPKGRRYG